MSSWRNAIPKRKYRERSQLEKRKHLGFLEKKKDYKKRAKHYHKIEDQLNSLKQKALNRNQDEFYYGMINSEFRAGKHRKFQKEESVPVIKKRKLKDLSLLDMQSQILSKKKEKLLANNHTTNSDNLHIRFGQTQPDHIQVLVSQNQEKLSQINKQEKFVKHHQKRISKEKELLAPGKKILVDEDEQIYKWFWERKR